MSIQFGATERFPVLRMSDLRAREASIRAEAPHISTFTATGKNQAGDWEHALVSGPEADILIKLDQLSSNPPRTWKTLFTLRHNLWLALIAAEANAQLTNFWTQNANIGLTMQKKHFKRLPEALKAMLNLAKAHEVMATITGLSHPYKALGNQPKPATQP